jgi:hypothetical protein
MAHQVPQNDHLNLSFVIDIYLVAKKMTTNGQKMAIFGLKFSGVFSSKIEKHSCQKSL